MLILLLELQLQLPTETTIDVITPQTNLTTQITYTHTAHIVCHHKTQLRQKHESSYATSLSV